MTNCWKHQLTTTACIVNQKKEHKGLVHWWKTTQFGAVLAGGSLLISTQCNSRRPLQYTHLEQAMMLMTFFLNIKKEWNYCQLIPDGQMKNLTTSYVIVTVVIKIFCFWRCYNWWPKSIWVYWGKIKQRHLCVLRRRCQSTGLNSLKCCLFF